MKTKTLYKLSQTSLLSWSIVQTDNTLRITHGQHEGKKQIDVVTHPCVEDADTDYDRRINIKQDRQGYTPFVPETVPDLPMLATPYNPKTLPDTVFIQPKFDGIRCIGSRDKMLSRRGTEITVLPLIQSALCSLPPGVKLDGELYCHGLSFQDHLSLIKRDDLHNHHHKIIYMVFDVQIEQTSFYSRLAYLEQIIIDLASPFIQLAPTTGIKTEDIPTVAQKLYSDHEGAIIRVPRSFYEHNKRSSSLQKYKWVTSEECKIVDVTAPSKGRSEGAVIYICQFSNGQTFKVVPKLPLYLRKAYYSSPSCCIGKWTRVYYEALSDIGKPLKPRAEGLFDGPTGSHG